MRLLLLQRAWTLLSTRVTGGPRFFSPAVRLLLLSVYSLVALHWYACLIFLTSRVLAEAGHHSWLSGEPWSSWPVWARYVRAFDRALLTIIGEGERADTHLEVAISCAGLLIGTASLAYFTSSM